MLKITRNEAFMLRENGRGRDVHVHNRTHHKTYYATESERTLEMLDKYRKACVLSIEE